MAAANRIKALFDSPKFNFWGAVVSASAEVASWVTNVEPRFVTPAAFVLTVFFIGRLAWTHYWDAQEYREALLPKFEIVFLPTNENESRPYLQMLKFVQVTPIKMRDSTPVAESLARALGTKRMLDRRYRVGVRSLSRAIVPNVQAVLVSCVPSGNHVHVGHRLQVMDSDPVVGERDLQPNPSSDPTLFFDVVNEMEEEGKVPKSIRFCFANPNLQQPVEIADEYRVVLRAQGGGWSHERAFVIKKTMNGQRVPVIMEPL